MVREYTTVQGDMVDSICKKIYGEERGSSELVLAANPELFEYTTYLPAGLVITLPDITVSNDDTAELLWE